MNSIKNLNCTSNQSGKILAGRFAYKVIYIFCLLLSLSTNALADNFDQKYSLYDKILKEFVKDGMVNYAGLKAKRRDLNRYLTTMGRIQKKDFDSWTSEQRLAFLINLYNASTLRLIRDHYPVKSIKDIGGWFKGPWDQPIVTLFGKQVTLDHLEHDIIRKQFKEPRIHMALVCAAKGCPPLRREAYTADKLESQLADQSRQYLASPTGLIIDKTKGKVFISSIFKWYGSDFPSVSNFIEKYSGKKLKGLKIDYLDYDWSLNEQN